MNFFAMFWAWSVSTRDLVDEVGIDGGVAAFGGFVDSGSGCFAIVEGSSGSCYLRFGRSWLGPLGGRTSRVMPSYRVRL